ncbi:N-acetyltransferase ESCO1 [Hemicordylus capensis]|uniref:N-acetyltransferase ESCO1 n=1 Tax=Hemicordylus capensis TaxID=884348 RepID=UPI00230291ED|nr:N-acetyltransferase ESCO1 [Hemicordylus capensis]XP_053105435.1 N-acetyltransferase ESCO1 [Hemicordylus capensis]XP_053105436.1 N-acetyltransferase ESCO1 [Hemicordylus capensis]XP_053105437.1 N-acetyltransferase ESCO1 [Hemicordylus capensis]
MAAQKRKSVLVEPPAKRQKLDKNSKLVSTSKERKSLGAKRVSNKNKVLKKETHKTSTKTNRSTVNKSRNRSSIPSSHSKLSQTHSKQTLNELKKKPCKIVCVKRTSLKSLGRSSSSKTSTKSSKRNCSNLCSSTKTSSKVGPRGKGKSNVVKNKTSHESKKQKKSSAGIKKTSTETVYNRCSALHFRTTHKNQCPETKVMKKNSKKSRTTSKFLKNSNVNLKVQSSKNRCAKNMAYQNTEQKLIETFSDKKPCESDQGKIATRTTGIKSKKSPVRITQEQLNVTKSKEMLQKEMVQNYPKLRHTVSHDEHLARRSPRLQQLSNVPTISLRSRKIKGHASTAKQCFQKKRLVPHIKNEKLKPVQQKIEQKPIKIDNKSKDQEKGITSVEKMNSLKEERRDIYPKVSDLTTSQDTFRDSNNTLDFSLQECKEEPGNTISCPVISTNSLISKEKDSVHKNGEISVKAKRVLPVSLNQKPACQPDYVMKSKKISILELCEEIAGEIESDTVEVKKEAPISEYGKEGEKGAVAELPQTAVPAEEETNQNSQCKRFFPSKKGMPIKCTVNGRHSSANKNSKWTKIKLAKANHVTQSLSNATGTPQLDLSKCTIPKERQATAVEMHLPKSQRKLIQSHDDGSTAHEQKLKTACFEGIQAKSRSPHAEQLQAAENGLPDEEKQFPEPTPDESFNLQLDSSPESTPTKITTAPPAVKQATKDTIEIKSQGPAPKQLVRTLFTDKTSETSESRSCLSKISLASKSGGFLSSEEPIQKLREVAKDSEKQLIIDAGQKRFGAISCSICGMLYTAANPEDETQHLLFHNQFISAVKYVGWKKERILAEYPDGKMIMVLPDDPKYALRKVDEIREMVDNDLGFQQAPVTCSRTKTFLFISNDKKVTGCLIAEHIQWGYRVIEEKIPEVSSENEKVIFERQKAWCCSTSPEPAICGISRIWVFSMMRRKKIASRMLECLRSNFIYGSYLSKEEIAFSDPTPDGKLFATYYFGTSQFLVYNFLNGQQPA